MLYDYVFVVVNISHPVGVIRIVFSNCAARPESTVAAVQPSDSIVTNSIPWAMIGSTVNIIPGRITFSEGFSSKRSENINVNYNLSVMRNQCSFLIDVQLLLTVMVNIWFFMDVAAHSMSSEVRNHG